MWWARSFVKERTIALGSGRGRPSERPETLAM
jgi:hypothetical protein